MTGGTGGCQSTPSSNARREREAEVVIGIAPSSAICERHVEVAAGTAHTHRTRIANDGWRRPHAFIERETRTIGGGGDWQIPHPSNAKYERQTEATAHPHRTRDSNARRRWCLVQHHPTQEASDVWKWWPAQLTPIERESRTTDGGDHPHRT